MEKSRMTETSRRLSVEETAAWLRERDRFLILSHKRPDGDALGSAAGLAEGLRKIGKIAYIYPNPEITPRYAAYTAPYLASETFQPDHVLTVDTAARNMFPKGSSAYDDCVELSIDHHGSHEDYSPLLLLEGDSASCGEIIYLVLRALGVEPDPNLASLLYIAVSTDTGCFRQANTTARSLTTAGELVRTGADHVHLNRVLFEMKTRARLAVEATIARNTRYSSGGRVAVATLSGQELLDCGATEDDLDNISSLVQQVEGVVCGILLREKPDCSKASVRASGSFNASRLCARFGGGGHVGAAGCEIKADLNAAAGIIAQAAAEELGE